MKSLLLHIKQIHVLNSTIDAKTEQKVQQSPG